MRVDVGSWTIRKILEWTTAFFEKKETDTPRLDAEVLLAHALGCDRLRLYMEMDRPLNESERAAYRRLVTRRADREPVAYLVGRKEFYSLAFTVKPGVLVPRPETEFVVDAVLDVFAKEKPFRFADLGTGSGCIAAAIAANRSGAEGVAVESSPAALAVARENLACLGMAERVRVLEADIKKLRAEDCGGQVDAVASNPPYVTEHEFETLAPEIRDYEPREALFDTDDDGLGCFRAAADAAARILRPGGLFACEVGAGRAAGALEHLARGGEWEGLRSVRDYGGVERVVVALLRGGNGNEA